MTIYTRTAADAIHHSTKDGTPAAHPQRLVSYPRLDPANAPTPFKEYRHVPISPLPRELEASTPLAVRVLSGERGEPSSPDASLLATLLYLAAGVTRATAGSARGRTFFRAAMSAGNLHPVETYVIAGPGVDGVPAGVHHFAPLEFGLTELRRGDFRAALSITAPVALVLSPPWPASRVLDRKVECTAREDFCTASPRHGRASFPSTRASPGFWVSFR